MRFISLGSLVAVVCGLAACGGGSTGGAAFTSTGPISVLDVNGAGASYFDFAADPDTRFLSQTELVAEGSAQFDGYMLAVPNGSLDALVGRTAIKASFSDGGNLTGEVTDLVFIAENAEVAAILSASPADGFNELSDNSDLTPLAGGLTLSDGRVSQINGAGTVRVGVNGEVEIPGELFNVQLDGTQTFDVSGSLLGVVSEGGAFAANGTLFGQSEAFNLGLQSVIFAQ